MGHTIPPFTMQYKLEKGRFSQFRRALLLAEDKRRFADMWDKAEFHVPAAEKASHPLPVATILMMVNLEQEKTIHRLEGRSNAQAERINQLEVEIENKTVQAAYLTERLKSLEKEVEQRLAAFRQEMLEIKYEYTS